MEIRVLGPLEVADNGRILALGSGRQLALVGLLLLNRNEVVSTEQLVDRLWEKPPPSASKIIRNYAHSSARSSATGSSPSLPGI
jgi:DNA-binding SARP family transcriptional activator